MSGFYARIPAGATIELARLIENLPPCQCGGALSIKDHGPAEEDQPEDQRPDPDFRFECFCIECGACDPNGYATAEAAAERGAQYLA
jgi:hypothetical protein